MLHELFLTHCTNGTLIMNPFTFYINNDIPVRIPSHPYVLINRSVLCNCCIEADNHYLLESLVTCNNTNPKLIMYSTINTAFANYLDMFSNLTESLELPIIKNRTTFKPILGMIVIAQNQILTRISFLTII